MQFSRKGNSSITPMKLIIYTVRYVLIKLNILLSVNFSNDIISDVNIGLKFLYDNYYINILIVKIISKQFFVKYKLFSEKIFPNDNIKFKFKW